MELFLQIIVCFFAGMGAGLGTGFAGLSAAAVISPLLITCLGVEPYAAVGIALSSDVLASAVSAYTYHKNKNLDIKNGLIMMVTVLLFTVVGSGIAKLVPAQTMGGFSNFMTLFLGLKFLIKPVMTTKEKMNDVSAKKRAVQSVVSGVLIGFICGFVGVHGADRRGVAFCFGRCTELAVAGALCGVYLPLGADCRKICQQGFAQNAEPRYGGGADRIGTGHCRRKLFDLRVKNNQSKKKKRRVCTRYGALRFCDGVFYSASPVSGAVGSVGASAGSEEPSVGAVGVSGSSGVSGTSGSAGVSGASGTLGDSALAGDSLSSGVSAGASGVLFLRLFVRRRVVVSAGASAELGSVKTGTASTAAGCIAETAVVVSTSTFSNSVFAPQDASVKTAASRNPHKSNGFALNCKENTSCIDG